MGRGAAMRLPNVHPPLHAVPARDDAATDGDSLSAIANGDRAAFEQLYRRYYERLFRFCLRVTGRIHLVEDIINETMLVVWRRAAQYRAGAAASTWIFGIAYRKSLKALKRDGRARVPTDATSALEPTAPDTRDREDVQAAIRRAVADLPPEHRAVVELTFHSNCSYDEIAQILD